MNTDITSITYIYPSDSIEARADEIVEYESRLVAALEERYPHAVVDVEHRSVERTIVNYHGGTDDDEMLIRDIAERVWGDVGTSSEDPRRTPDVELVKMHVQISEEHGVFLCILTNRPRHGTQYVIASGMSEAEARASGAEALRALAEDVETGRC